MIKSSKKRSKQKKNLGGIEVSEEAMLSEASNVRQLKKLEILLEEAEEAVDSFNYEEAISKLNEILRINSVHVKALEMLAGVYTEQFKWSEAQNLLKKCIELSPDNGYTKYFSMGQLCEGEESVLYYKKGIQVIEKELENAENVDPSEKITRSSLLRSLSDAYCSVAELFMTDCCFAENAEGKCYESIEAAIKADPSNPEAYQCLANFHLVKEQIKEAKDAIEKSLSLWLPQHEAFRSGECNPVTNDSENVIPGYDSRIKCSKLLIELEMFEEAVQILDGLIDDDDEIVEVWYLLGWTNYLHGDEYKLNALYYFNKAKKVAAKTGQEDDDMLSHIDELLVELNAAYPDYCEDEEIENEYNSDFSSDSENENKMET